MWVHPQSLPFHKRRFYRLQNINIVLIEGVLSKRNFNGVLRQCVNKEQAKKILNEYDNSLVGRHFSMRATSMKITCVGYFWPILYSEAHALVRSCKNCQFFIGKRKKSAMHLKPIVSDEPFALLGLDFIGMINILSSTEYKWILMVIYYFTRWVEAIYLRNTTEAEILNFIEEITCRFGLPKTIIYDNARAFLGSKICQFALDNGIFLKTSSNYYPQGNGLAESTNKNLIRLIKRIGSEHKNEWHKHLKVALWAKRITSKKIFKTSSYELFYGKEVMSFLFPWRFQHWSY